MEPFKRQKLDERLANCTCRRRRIYSNTPNWANQIIGPADDRVAQIFEKMSTSENFEEFLILPWCEEI
ncbi:MAG: hypothetical protein HYS18_08495 [Burkholderiales bacterium]|nr:hypothetical protein [Burkholderiales bacterium]